MKLEYFFIDDNVDLESKQILQDFQKRQGKNCVIEVADSNINTSYECTEQGHLWRDELLWKVAAFKDKMIEKARNKGSDYLFLIDSDIVLHPKTMSQLVSAKKEIISNVFWTVWPGNTIAMPQVWLYDHYTQYEAEPGVHLSDAEVQNRYLQFLVKMRTPGTYEVGGLGACTLISKNALSKDISFKKIKNLTFWGEDRHFCIRAGALGIPLHVDTHLPAYHIYRESALAGVENFKTACKMERKLEEPKITLCMMVKKGSSKYLKENLEKIKNHIHEAVILVQEGSLAAAGICQEVLQEVPHLLLVSDSFKETKEKELRKRLWNETVKKAPDWILFLDADEAFENHFGEQVKNLVSNRSMGAFYFRSYDFWDKEQYREEEKWNPDRQFRPFLVQYFPDLPYNWSEEQEKAIQVDRMPATVASIIGSVSDLRVKNFSYATKEDREEKYKEYETLSAAEKEVAKSFYESLLDEEPKLSHWHEEGF